MADSTDAPQRHVLGLGVPPFATLVALGAHSTAEREVNLEPLYTSPPVAEALLSSDGGSLASALRTYFQSSPFQCAHSVSGPA